jgi:hypothetical protein
VQVYVPDLAKKFHPIPGLKPPLDCETSIKAKKNPGTVKFRG